jgi:hypothetical protein
MALRAALLALLWLISTSLPAAAQDWAINSLDGSARIFARGEWAPANVGDPIIPAVLIETEGRMRLARGAQSLDLGAGARIRIENEDAALVRAFEGALGATVDVGAGESFVVMTTYASIEARAAIFGLVAGRDGADLAVRDGAVRVTDLTNRRSFELRAGQSVRLRRGVAEADIRSPEAGDPAMAAAPEKPQGGGSDAAAAKSAAALDPRSVGALGRADKADAKANPQAVDAVRALKDKKAKANPQDVATAVAVGRELFQDPEVELKPWDDSYQWTEVDDGVVRLKPISRVIAELHGAERYEFWLLVVFASLGLGGLAGFAMQSAGLGLTGNTLLVMTAFVAAILVRDLFFRDGALVEIEPYLSLGMMLAAMPAFLIAGAVAKARFG